MIRRTIVILALAAVLVGGFFCAQATALTVTGGSDQQKAFAREVIESCWLDWQWADARVNEVDLIVEEHHEPYWETIDVNYAMAAAGLAWPGNIRVDSKYPPGYDTYFGEIVAHEWCHQIWYAMPAKWTRAWIDAAVAGHEDADFSAWYTMPAENFAECMRVALFDPRYYVNDTPRTALNIPSVEDTREFVTSYYWGVAHPFRDLGAEDIELNAAAGYLYSEGIIQGYEDSTVGPYFPLLRRHVALICQRAGLPAPGWLEDYTPATRGDVRDCVPGLTWLEDRWGEGITRGQLARLIWRAP